MRLLFLAVVFLGSLRTNAQQEGIHPMPLQACIDYALKNNISIKQNDLQIRNNSNVLEESKLKRYPNLNAFTNLNLYEGRNINPYTNGIITSATGSNTLGLQSAVTLFDGFLTRNNIAYNQLNLEASNLDIQALKNQITLNVVIAYLNILSQQDLLVVASKQVEVSKIQLERSNKLVRIGTQAENVLYDLQAQLANDELSVVNAQNNLESTFLSLKQLMNMPVNNGIQVVREQVPNPDIQPYPASSQAVYDIAQSFLPEIQAADLRIKLAQRNIDISKSYRLPTVSANASLGSNATTAALQSSGKLGPEIEQNLGIVNFAGTNYPLIIRNQSPILEGIAYPKQLSGNFNSSIGLTIRIPIMNAYNAKFRQASAEIQAQNAQYQADNARITLRQNIEQAYTNMSNAAKRYLATQKQVQALEQAFRVAEIKFEVGTLSATDYAISKTNLDRSRSNLIQTKYDYIFRTKILDYYQNKPLSF